MNSGLFCGSIEKNLSGFCLDEADDTERCIRRDAYGEMLTASCIQTVGCGEMLTASCTQTVAYGK